MLIQEVSAKTGLKASAIRYYEESGLLPPIARESNGHRVFKESDVTQIKMINMARKIGFTIGELKTLVPILSGSALNDKGSQIDTALMFKKCEHQKEISRLSSIIKFMDKMSACQCKDLDFCTILK